MKKAIIAFVLAFALGISFYMVKGNAQMGPGMMGGWGYGQSYCPNCGRPMGPGGGYGMGPGMMGPGWGMGPGMMGRGYGMGPGMMHQGWGMGSGMMGPGHGMGPGMMGPGYGYGPQYQQPQKPMEEDNAKELLENYLKSTRNPNLKLGKIKDTGSTFEGEILTKDNSLVDKIAVDKYTGWMRSAY